MAIVGPDDLLFLLGYFRWAGSFDGDLDFCSEDVLMRGVVILIVLGAGESRRGSHEILSQTFLSCIEKEESEETIILI